MSGGFRKGTQNSKLVRINSSNRHGGTNSDFVIDLGTSLQQVSQVSVCSVQFYNVFYNIFATNVSRYNNIVSIVVGPTGPGETIVSFSLEPGFYSSDDLISAITTAVTSLTTFPVTSTFDSINNKYTIKTDVLGHQFSVIQPLNSSDNNSPSEMLGFVYTNGILTFDNVGEQATFIPNMVHTSIAYLSSAALAPMNSVDEKGLSSNILQPINVTSGWGELNVFECRVDELCELIYPRGRVLNRIDIQLVDHEGFNLDLQNTELNIELRVWFNSNY